MEMHSNDDEKYYRAKKRVEEIKGFYGNLTAYILVNACLIFINLYTAPNHLWFYWPLLWWGIGVVFHAIKVFDLLPVFGKGWQEKKIKEFMDKEIQNKNKWQ